MGKFEDYGILAEKYYVEDQLPISTIGKKLNLTDKTLHDWKKKGNWEDKRRDYLTSQCSCNKNLYELVRLLTDKAVNEIRTTGTYPDPAALNFIGKMADKLPKIKMFEENVVNELMNKSPEDSEKSEDMKLKIANSIDAKLMGNG